MNISEDQKRWLVVGIAFNKLVPQIRPLVEHSLQTEYQSLRASHNIHIQTEPGHLKKHPKNLKYENINSNSNHKLLSGRFDFSKFDYRVSSHVDFAKLYVHSFMAKFSAFDGKCDGSAVLLLVGEVPVFPPAVQASAKSVKDSVRNEWAHCNFTDWDAAKFQSSFQEMKHLVQSIGLSTADEAKLLSELNDWETKGVAFCGNSPVDPSLLGLVQNEVSQLSSNLVDFVCQYKEQKDLLESQLLNVKQSVDRLLELPEKVEQIEHEMQTIKQKLEDLGSNTVRSDDSGKRPAFFGALDRNEFFTGRKKEMKALEKAFEDTSQDVPGVARREVKVYGLCGLGGCGKSSVAFEYAWRNMERYPGGIFVVNGESDELMRASLQGIYREFVTDAASYQNKEAKPFEQMMNESLSWLSNLREKWLLLVDNMDEKELSPSGRRLFFGQWKRNTSGDILVTSRRNSQVLCEDLDLSFENCLVLDPFSIDESVEFLKKRIGLLPEDDDQDDGKKALALELGGLPLALEQAAAYIKALNCPIQLYLEQYRSQKSTLLNTRSAKPRAEIYSEERLAVQTTWLLNFSYIENREKDKGLGKAASVFMKVAAYLSPDAIPIETLNTGAPEIQNEDLKKRLKMPLGAEQIVDLLVRFSLFKRNADDTLTIHRLVQDVLRELCDSEDKTDEVLSSALRMLHQALLNCVGQGYFLFALKDLLGSPERMLDPSEAQRKFIRWQHLFSNAFHLVCSLFEDSSFRPRFCCEEALRVFNAATLYCDFFGMGRQVPNLQQIALEIVCAIKKPVRYYKDDDLKNFSRVLPEKEETMLMSMEFELSRLDKRLWNSEAGEKNFSLHTAQTDELVEMMKVVEPKAREAFVRGDFQTSVDLYSEIVPALNFEATGGILTVEMPQLLVAPLGKFLCLRGIAHLKLGNFEKAVEDFNASTMVDIEQYRGYYWKAYALCKLASESGGIDTISRAEAAMALLQFKFAQSKSNDIKKLHRKFPGLLGQIEYKFVSHVSELRELEGISRARNDFSKGSLTIILGEGHYRLNELRILGGRYYFVCLPGCTASLYFVRGISLSRGSFLFENIQFTNPGVVDDSTLEETTAVMISNKGVKESPAAKNYDTITLGRTHGAATEHTGGRDHHNVDALIEAKSVHSLVIDHCVISAANCSGVVFKSHSFPNEEIGLLVRSSIISCGGTGIELRSDAPLSNISILDNTLLYNLYGIVLDTPSQFLLKGNLITCSSFSGVVVVRGEGRLLQNSLFINGKHGILLNKSGAIMEENKIFGNFGWGIVCSCESYLQCKENSLVENFCGGINFMLNGKGNILVERCDLSEEFGPAIFPKTANELCQVKTKWLEMSTRATVKVPISIFLSRFVEYSNPVCKSTGKFNHSVLKDNRVSNASDSLFQMKRNFCSSCHKDLPIDTELIECPNCLVASYCSSHCAELSESLHRPVCKAILEANKVCMDFVEFRKLNTAPLSSHKGDRNKAGVSLCVMTTFCLPVPSSPNLTHGYPTHFLHGSTPAHLCVLACPKENVWTYVGSRVFHYLVVKRGRHLPDYMMHMKAACVAAKVDIESKKVTIYSHRIFPLEKVPDAFSWVERSLHEYCKYIYAPGGPTHDAPLEFML